MSFIQKLIYKIFLFKCNHCDCTDTERLFIRFIDKCPNKCKFCYDKYCNVSLKSQISGKKLAKKVNKFNRKYLMVSGGEPCLDMKRLYAFVSNLNLDIHIASLMTSLPKTAYFHNDLLEKIIERCDIVDISSHGLNNEDDELVYQTKLGYDKQAFISKLARKYPKKIYVSCVMRKSNKTFTTLEMLEKRIMHYYSMGVRNFYLNEMGNDYKIFQSEDDYISINTILKNSGRHDLGGCFSNGCKCDISYLFKKKYPGINIQVSRRCYRAGGGTQYITWRDCLKVLINKFLVVKDATPVMHGDGHITNWYSNFNYVGNK